MQPIIVDAVRTPIGRLRGGLKDIRPDDLAGHAIAALVKRTGLKGDEVDDVYLGCANQAGEDNRNVARMALLLAGLPRSVPGATVNRLCGSGLEAVAMAARAIRAGEGDVFIAGGVESMTRAPWSMAKPGEGHPSGPPAVFDTALGWRFPNPRLAAMFPLEQMGETAENLAEEYRIARGDQDAFALQSHRRAVAAQREGKFRDEMIPVEVPRGKETATVEEDEGPRADTSLEKLAKLKPAFRDGGTVTAGNSSSLNDGAAAVLVCSEEAARARGWRPLVRILAAAAAGVDPQRMGIGPVPAVKKALARAGLAQSAVQLWELNEAFAAQSIAVLRDLGLPPDSPDVNPNGGAIALGHPLGCSGARILTTLVHELVRRGARHGVATMCIGVGQGIALVVERG